MTIFPPSNRGGYARVGETALREIKFLTNSVTSPANARRNGNLANAEKEPTFSPVAEFRKAVKGAENGGHRDS